MFAIHTKRVLALVVLFIAAGLAPVSVLASDLTLNTKSPDLPLPLCEGVRVPEGNKFAYKAYAVGVQLYRWNGTTWTLVEPIATLFADPDYKLKVGTHYLGPTWEGNSGSSVVASRLNQCTPDTTAIPWLLLQTVTADGPGIFGSITFIQRVNTKGGLTPTAPGTSIGAVAPVPYTAEYYFYRV